MEGRFGGRGVNFGTMLRLSGGDVGGRRVGRGPARTPKRNHGEPLGPRQWCRHGEKWTGPVETLRSWLCLPGLLSRRTLPQTRGQPPPPAPASRLAPSRHLVRAWDFRLHVPR